MGKNWNKTKVPSLLQEEGVWSAGTEALNGLAAPPDGPCPMMLVIKNKGTVLVRTCTPAATHFAFPRLSP